MLHNSSSCLIRFEDAIDAFKMIFDGGQTWLLGWTIGNMFSISVFNYAGQIERNFSLKVVIMHHTRYHCDQGAVCHHQSCPGPDSCHPHLGSVPDTMGTFPLCCAGLLPLDRGMTFVICTVCYYSCFSCSPSVCLSLSVESGFTMTLLLCQRSESTFSKQTHLILQKKKRHLHKRSKIVKELCHEL